MLRSALLDHKNLNNITTNGYSSVGKNNQPHGEHVVNQKPNLPCKLDTQPHAKLGPYTNDPRFC